MSSSTTSSERHYLAAWLGPFVLLHVLAAMSTAVVDPHGVFGLGLFSGLAEHRLNASRSAKAERVRHGGFDTMVFGSSRVHFGIDPKSPAWGGQRVYNAGIPGSTLDENLDLIQLGLTSGSLARRVLLFVQFDQFINLPTDDPEARRSRLNPARGRIEYYVDHLIGYASLIDVWTVLKNRFGEPPARYDDTLGMLRWRKPLSNARKQFGDKLAREHELRDTRIYYPKSMAHLRAVLGALCAAKNDVTLAVSPIHALHLELLWRDLGAPKYEHMLHELASLSADPRTACASVWDFSGFSGLRAERVPGADEPPRAMHNYIESSHFSPDVGTQVIYAIAHGGRTEDAGAFGDRLDAQTLEQDIARLHRERAEYASAHGDELAWLATLTTPKLVSQ